MQHDAPPQSMEAIFAKAAKVLAGMRVLVVDDSPTNRIIVHALLTRAGIETLCAASGALALELLAREPFDLVLMDIELPEMDGYETTRRIRRQLRLPGLPVVAMTAHDLADARAACQARGIDDIVAKPIAVEELLAVLKAWRRA